MDLRYYNEVYNLEIIDKFGNFGDIDPLAGYLHFFNYNCIDIIRNCKSFPLVISLSSDKVKSSLYQRSTLPYTFGSLSSLKLEQVVYAPHVFLYDYTKFRCISSYLELSSNYNISKYIECKLLTCFSAAIVKKSDSVIFDLEPFVLLNFPIDVIFSCLKHVLYEIKFLNRFSVIVFVSDNNRVISHLQSILEIK